MKPLKILKRELYHLKNEEKIYGKNKEMSGDCFGLRGDLSLIPADARPCNITEFVKK